MILQKKEVSVKLTQSRGVIPSGIQFTHIDPYHSDKKHPHQTGVRGHYDVEGLVDYINNNIGENDPKDKHSFLTGIYHKGTTSVNVEHRTNLLFFDIDIKRDNENGHLYRDKFTTASLVSQLKQDAVFVARSKSRRGITGAFLVEGLADLEGTQTHRIVCDHITKSLEEKFAAQGIKVLFDKAQNKFRQPRFFAHQFDGEVVINPSPLSFSFEVTEKLLEVQEGVPDYVFTGKKYAGSIREQFNAQNPIEQALLSSGFTNVGGNRYKYKHSTSSSSGEVLGNVYMNNSATYGDSRPYDSFDIISRNMGVSPAEFYRKLKGEGYADIVPEMKEIPTIKTAEDAFLACKDYMSLPLKVRDQFYEKVSQNAPVSLLKHLRAYLRLKNLHLEYETTIKVKKWVSEASEEIFDLADLREKVVVVSETGTGKTYAIIGEFINQRPDARMLFIAPLTTLVNQIEENEYTVTLTGASTEDDHLKALDPKTKVVVATHAQAVKHLGVKGRFDYIVRDEIHSDITGQSFRRSTIADVNRLVDESGAVQIGLTGTPTYELRRLGFEFIKIDAGVRPQKIVQRVDNRDARKIIMQHQKTAKGAAIYRVNSKDTLKETKKSLMLKFGYKDDEILILTGDKEDKMSPAFEMLEREQLISTQYKVVLTTGVIDEGVSIKNTNYTDVVFIDTDYHPRPEALKQFLNRFRVKAAHTTYYHYRRSENDETFREFTSTYESDKRLLEEEAEEGFERTSYSSLASHDSFFKEDDTINEYYLAFKDSERFFDTFMLDEFNKYITNNYNVEVEEDDDYKYEKLELEKKDRKALRMQISKIYNNEQDLVKNIVAEKTSDDILKTKIADTPRAIEKEDGSIDFIEYNITAFENIIKQLVQVEELSANTASYMLKEDGSLDTPQAIRTKLQQLRLYKTIMSPQNGADERVRQKLLGFVFDVDSQVTMDEDLMMKLFRKQRIINWNIEKGQTLKTFLTLNSKFFWDSKKGVFKLKSEFPQRWEQLDLEWMKNMREEFKVEEEFVQMKLEFEEQNLV